MAGEGSTPAGPLRLAYLLHRPLPDAETDSEQAVRTAMALAAAGATVDLLLPDERPDREVRAAIGCYYGRGPDDLPPGLAVRATPAPRGLGRGLGGAIGVLARLRRAGREGYDALIVRAPETLAAALLGRTPVVFDTYRVDLSLHPARAPWRWWCYRHPRLLAVGAHSECARRALVSAGVAPEQSLLLRNGHAPELLEPRLDRGAARRALGLPPDRPLLVYTGHVRPSKGTDLLVELARRLPQADLAVVGGVEGSAALSAFRALAATAPNLRVVERLRPAAIGPWLYAADVLLIPPTRAPLERYGRTVLPLKVYLYLAAGRAIVAPDLEDLREVLVDDRNAVLVPPDDPAEAVRAVAGLLDDRQRMARLGAAAAADGAACTWEARARLLIGFVRRRLAASRTG